MRRLESALSKAAVALRVDSEKNSIHSELSAYSKASSAASSGSQMSSKVPLPPLAGAVTTFQTPTQVVAPVVPAPTTAPVQRAVSKEQSSQSRPPPVQGNAQKEVKRGTPKEAQGSAPNEVQQASTPEEVPVAKGLDRFLAAPHKASIEVR